MATAIKSETIRARVTPELKRKAEAVLEKLGISTTEVITMLLNQIVLQKAVPFEARVPNRATRKSMENIDKRKGLHRTTVADLKKEFGIA